MVLENIYIVSLVLLTFVTLLFILSLIIHRNDVADVAWGIGIFLVTLTSYVLRTADSLVLNVLLLLIGLWSVRLSLRIFLRNRKKTEDYRYKKWRDEWGTWFYLRSYVQVYLLQGFLMLVVGYSAVHASTFPSNTFGILSILGIVLWSCGFIFETVSDYQLDRFVANNPKEGSVLRTGLWKYSRHPNYFGEVTCWWGIWLIIATTPLSYIALISPLTITFLILKVSGIPMLEKKFKGNEAFEEYKKRTSAFFPLPPKKSNV